MKTKELKILISVVTMMIALFTTTSYSRVININATVGDTFVPANVNAIVGDTIQWTRTGGDHTTTCNGTPLTSRPPGADPWHAPLTSANPTFRYVITVAGLYNYKCEPHAPGMVGVINASTSSVTQFSELVNDYKLSQNYPNPFNPTTKIKFSIPNSSKVSLKIYNSVGQEMTELVNEKLNIGSYEVDWNAINFTSGIYYYTIQAEKFIETKKMILIK